MKQFHDVKVLTTNTVDNPVVYTFKIDKGAVTEVGIYFPAGCQGLVYAKVFFQAHQILPRNQEAWCRGTNGWWSETADIPVIDSPLQVKVVAYSVEANFDHTITVGIELSPFSLQPEWQKLIKLLEMFVDTVGITIPWQQQEAEVAAK